MADDVAQAQPAAGAGQVSLETFCTPQFWRQIIPSLTIETGVSVGHTAPLGGMARIQARMAKDGYFGESDPLLGELAPRLAEGIQRCQAMGLPPVFIFLFDEPWAAFARLSPVLGQLLGPGYKLLPDFWAWHVDPLKGESGWRPHRDKGLNALAPDGSPLSLTVWIPITEANPLNSCIYLLPQHLDAYFTAGPGSPSNMVAARALPAKPGEYLAWNQAVLHWGSGASEFAAHPRMSMALEFQRGDIAPFNQPQLDILPYPSFETRLKLVGKQIKQYTHMYGFSDQLVGLADALLNRP